MDTAASADPRTAAEAAGAFPVMVFGLTASTTTDALGIVALAVFMVKVKLCVNGPAGSNSDAPHKTNTVGALGDREDAALVSAVKKSVAHVDGHGAKQLKTALEEAAQGKAS